MVIRLLIRNFCSSKNNLKNLLLSMPKDNSTTKQLKQDRINKAQKKKNFQQSGVVTVNVIGNGSLGSPGVVCINMDHQQYLFNCGEGTQRLAIESIVKFSKITNVFLTQAKWEQMGGLCGLSMTLQGIGIPEITVHSPKSILPLYHMTRMFSVSAELNVASKTIEDGSFTDEDLHVTYVPLRKATPGDDMVMCYVCRLTDIPGTLNIDKCIDLKIPKGPILSKLKNGEDYTFPDGRIVKSADVVIPASPGPVFLMVDCPTEDYLSSLETDPILASHQVHDTPLFIFHFSPKTILDHPVYKGWLSKFPTSTAHYAINEDNPVKSVIGSHIMQAKLRYLDTKLFPRLYEEDWKAHPTSNAMIKFCPSQLQLRIRPSYNVEFDDCPSPCDETSIIQDLIKEIPNLCEDLQKYKEQVIMVEETKRQSCQMLEMAPSGKDDYPVINFLGTASAQPGKDRNVSCILVKVNKESSIMLDCGEGSYGQMVRFFGKDTVDDELSKVKCIFISHLHADHHLGLISLLVKRKQLGCPPTTVIVPKQVHNWLVEYDRVYERINDSFVAKQNEYFMSSIPFESDLMKELGLRSIQTARVIHCRDSFGIAIRTNDNFKIVYSGDAMPSPYLEIIGKKADVLIHEATMEDDLLEEAELKKHSTTSQAIDMARKMDAKVVLLTHFSQRYAKIPVIPDNLLDARVGIAFDNLSVKPCDFDRLHLLLQPLRLIFKDHHDELRSRIERKHRRNRLIASMKVKVDDDHRLEETNSR